MNRKLTSISLLAVSLAVGCGGKPDAATSDEASSSGTQPGGAASVAAASAAGPGVAYDANMAESLDPSAGDPAGGTPATGMPAPAGTSIVASPTPAAADAPLIDQGGVVAAEPGVAAAGGASAMGEDDAILPEPESLPEDPVVPEMPSATNPFVDVGYDPLSTFAVDVDTASYDIFRRDVLNGFLPNSTQVRLEEFVNYFSYDYPAPEAGAEEPFEISLAAAPNVVDNGTTLLRVGIQGELAPAFEKRAANLVFLVDVSGSMQSVEKLPLVQKVLTQSLEILDPEDTVSIVTYASGTGVALAPTPISQSDTIAAVINALSAGGSTNGAGGIQLAYEQAEAAFIEGGINHVVLCTDGDFNVGVSSTDGLVDLIEEKRLTGVTFTALGFGASNNDQMMELVSNAGNGVYGVIANEDQAVTYVSERMLHNLVFIAKDVKIQVEFNSEHVAAYRLLGYENRAIADEDFRDDAVDAGEIGAGHRVTALYELVMSGGQVPEPDGALETEDGPDYDGEVEIAAEDLVLVKVRYKDVDATVEDPAYEVARTLTPEDVASSHRDLDADFQWALAVATFAEVLKGSPYTTLATLDEIDDIISEQASRDSERTEFATLFDSARVMLDGSVAQR